MNAFLTFLAKNPIGTALKVAVGVVLASVLSNIQDFHLPATAAMAITVLIPPVINWLNPQDTRYGVGSAD